MESRLGLILSESVFERQAMKRTVLNPRDSIGFQNSLMAGNKFSQIEEKIEDEKKRKRFKSELVLVSEEKNNKFIYFYDYIVFVSRMAIFASPIATLDLKKDSFAGYIVNLSASLLILTKCCLMIRYEGNAPFTEGYATSETSK